MGRVTMYQEPLERYLVTKINNVAPTKIERVVVRRLDGGRDRCNWDVAATKPALPMEIAADVERDVILPIREAIDLAD